MRDDHDPSALDETRRIRTWILVPLALLVFWAASFGIHQKTLEVWNGFALGWRSGVSEGLYRVIAGVTCIATGSVVAALLIVAERGRMRPKRTSRCWSAGFAVAFALALCHAFGCYHAMPAATQGQWRELVDTEARKLHGTSPSPKEVNAVRAQLQQELGMHGAWALVPVLLASAFVADAARRPTPSPVVTGDVS